MGIQFFPQTNDQTPWSTALLSLLSYVLLGPLAVVISYHPWWDPEQLPWMFPVYVGTAVLAIIISFVIGAVHKFPRWSYPSAIYLIFMFTFLVTFLINRTPWDINHEALILVVVTGLAILTTWRLTRLKPFLANLQRDWTTLSYGMYACSLLLISSMDHDEIPSLNLLALLPSLIWLCGALAHLRIRSAKRRVGVLVLSVVLGTSLWWSPVIDGMSGSLASFLAVSGIMLIICTILAGLVLAPMLIGVILYNHTVRRTNA